ncbi:hypothetical protein N2152v2_004280 [Parachlorella kessleri]
MGDSWEDWDAEEFTPAVPGAVPAAAPAVDKARFADEDQGEEDEPKWKKDVPKPQQPKKQEKKYDESKGMSSLSLDEEGPLDDPELERQRQQRLVEEADFKATMELFGGGRELEGFIPKSAKDFEEYAALVVQKYLLPQAKSTHYKLLVKQLIKHSLVFVSAQDAKDIETSVAGIRADKLKEEKAAAAAGKKTTKKAALNVGKSGGSAGLDDYKFDVADEDDYDFM